MCAYMLSLVGFNRTDLGLAKLELSLAQGCISLKPLERLRGGSAGIRECETLMSKRSV